ncbi:MAG: IS1634 family transposase [Acidimicrobiales bacterium]
MTATGPGGQAFDLVSEKLASLFIVDHFLSRLGFDERLERHLPKHDGRLRLSPGQVVGVVCRNIVVRHRPLYAIGEWAAPFDPSLLGLTSGDAGHLNDDRVGRALDRLFDCDRASLLTETVLAAVTNFEIDCGELHNDSTTVTFTGDAYGADVERGGKKVPVVTYGHNKDFRPDLRQLVYVLTVSSDGAVPVALRVEDGNTNDDVTHVPTWDGLVAMFGRSDFRYVADSKLSRPRQWATSPLAAGVLSPSSPTGGERTGGSRTGSRPMRLPGRRRSASPASPRATPTVSGAPSPPRFPQPMATG